MAGNTFGVLFKVTTFGESHGAGIGVVIDGCPPGLPLASEDFSAEMARRRPGHREHDSARKEEDQVQILSGVFEGLTTGAPICLFIPNNDADSRPYDSLALMFRPGHGDYAYFKKYGHFDYRGGGRYSARETAARVAAGVVAQKILAAEGILVTGYTIEIGGIKADTIDLQYAKTDPLGCPDPLASTQMVEKLQEAKEQGDSLGGVVELRVTHCPPGLGDPVFDKLDADLAKALFSVGTIKGVEIGAGFKVAISRGSENNDPITPTGFASNNAGGILAGISTGQEIILKVAVKPIPSIRKEQDTIDRTGKPCKISVRGRHDVCAIPRIIPVLEAMVRIVLTDHLLRFRTLGQQGI